MTGHPLIGLAAALLVEARHWTRMRWEFDERAFLRAWHLSVVLILFGAVSVWIDGPSSKRIYGLFSWLPVLLLPVQFVQSFGTLHAVPLHVFSVIAHNRIKRQRKLGHDIRSPEFNFGYVTIVLALLGASLGDHAEGWMFLPGAIVITAWALRSKPAGKSGLVPWFATLLAVAGIGIAGQLGMDQAKDLLAKGIIAARAGGDANHLRSRIELGGLGEQKNSSQIQWRVHDPEGGIPARLRTASYNTYLGGTWIFRHRPEEQLFESMTIVGDGTDTAYHIASDDPEIIRDPAPGGMPGFTLVGAVRRNSLVPTPIGTRSLRNTYADNLERNALGTMRIEPKHAVLSTRVAWHDANNLESDPWPEDRSPDHVVPRNERPGLQQVIDELDLDQGDLQEKISRLRLFFLREFEYARYRDFDTDRLPAGRAISHFLVEERRGHCELFATATALLLREVGVPARYSIGYATVEYGAEAGEIIYRGTHAHAWCRAWDAAAGRWIDVDLTPPDWASREGGELGLRQTIADWWQRLREDLLAWRSRPGNAGKLNIALSILGAIVAGYVILRLWQSRRRDGPAVVRHEPSTLPDPLRPLVRLARRSIGPRPPGMPLGRWLRQLEEPLGPSTELDQLIRLHARLRFDPVTPEAADEPLLAELAKAIQQRLRST
jgi:hypothetical protein